MAPAMVGDDLRAVVQEDYDVDGSQGPLRMRLKEGDTRNEQNYKEEVKIIV